MLLSVLKTVLEIIHKLRVYCGQEKGNWQSVHYGPSAGRQFSGRHPTSGLERLAEALVQLSQIVSHVLDEHVVPRERQERHVSAQSIAGSALWLKKTGHQFILRGSPRFLIGVSKEPQPFLVTALIACRGGGI